MKAYVNHGRWVVHCPAHDCQAASKVKPHLICDCRDETVCDHPQVPCGAIVKVEMPIDEAEITRLLDLRPSRANRNWWPDETVEDVKAENVTNGVRV